MLQGQSVNVTIELVKAGLALSGAVVGAFFGARLALEKFKRERSFDKRLEWHLAALRAIHDFETEHARWDRSVGTEERPEFEAAFARFQRVIVESKAFMSNHVYLLVAYHAYLGARLTQPIPIAQETERMFKHRRTEERKGIQEAESVIVKELRRLIPDDPAPLPTRIRGGWQRMLRRLKRKTPQPQDTNERVPPETPAPRARQARRLP